MFDFVQKLDVLFDFDNLFLFPFDFLFLIDLEYF